MSPIVSVCIQTYQHVDFIEECLDSILMQKTNFKFEIILGEDESSDGTREICKIYAEKHPDKIRFFLRNRNDVIYINGSPTGRFNFIENLKTAEGKYIALCEGDDYWTDPLKLQKQVDFLENNEDYTGSFHYTKVKSQNEDYGKVNGKHDGQLNFEVKDTLSYYSLFHTSSFLFRSSALEIPKWFPHIQSADMALFSIVASKGPLRCIPEVMSIYRKHDGGITNTDTYLNIRYNLNRIKLLYYLDTFHNCIYHEKVEKLVDKHINEIRTFNEKKSVLQRVFTKIKNNFF